MESREKLQLSKQKGPTITSVTRGHKIYTECKLARTKKGGTLQKLSDVEEGATG